MPLIASHPRGAHYRQSIVALWNFGWGELQAVCRARSRADFISKLGIVVEETDQSVFWLELLTETGIVSPSRITQLNAEANELLAIFGASQLTAKQNAA